MSRGRKSKKDSLLTALKQAILQQAIQGKLTVDWRAENPDIEPASELLKRIQAEKQKLIDEKKIRKGKKQSSNDLGDIKSEIPVSWKYVDLDDISQFITDGTHQTPTYTEKGRIFLSAQNVKPFRFMPDNHKYISKEAYLICTKGKKTERGDLLIGRVGSKGETAVIDCDIEFAFYVSLGFVKTFKHYTNPEYLAIVMNSPYGIKYATGNMSSLGTSAGNYNLGRIRSFSIPFPPLPEQTAIVQKVEALMQKCDALEKGESIQHHPMVDKKADQLLNRYEIGRQLLAELPQQQAQVKQLKQAVLQEAIQGKLTADWRAENPHTEPASELLKRIQAEKQKLIDEKKIRKEKPLPPISAEEIPFDLPDGWVWCRLGELGFTQTGTTPAKNDNSNYGDFIPFLQPSNITENGLNFKCIGLSEDGLSKGRLIKKYSNFMVCIGGSSGKTCFSEVDVSCNQQINTITAYHDIDYKYLDIVLKSPHFQTSVWSTIKQGSTPILNKGKWASIPVPICSNPEQTAIVQKVEALMQTCNDLEIQIKQSETHATQLMQAVIKEAFEAEKASTTP